MIQPRLSQFFYLFREEPIFYFFPLSAGVGVHLSLAAGHSDVDESASVQDPLLGTALGLLRLLLRLDLGGLRLDFTGTSEGSVDFAHDCGL